MKFVGSYPALITPFRRGRLDEPSLRGLVRYQLLGASAGLVLCGSTGEASTLRPQEYRRVIDICLREAAGKVPVIAGVGSNATWKTVELAREAQSLGVRAILVSAPYYNKPTQEGLFLHFREVARAVRLPIIVYNIPGRTAVNILPSTLARLAHALRNIVAVKEASGSLDQVSEILNLCPGDFTVLSGDDSLTLPMMSVGARGVVSVIANILPEETSRMCSSFLAGDTETARTIHSRLFPLVKALFVETNPIPIKAAAWKLGLCRNELRLPLTPIRPENLKTLESALELAPPSARRLQATSRIARRTT